MKARTLLLMIVLIAIGTFAVLNWSAFMAPTSLSVGFAVVQAPLGLVMLGLLAFLTLLFLVFVVYVQTSVLLDARRHARELKANRELADQAEASRFTELRGFLEGEMKTLSNLNSESRDAVQARLDQLDRDLRSAVEESGNTLVAYFSELEDRLERESRGQPPDLPP